MTHLLAEFIGTFGLVFGGCGAIVISVAGGLLRKSEPSDDAKVKRLGFRALPATPPTARLASLLRRSGSPTTF